jgi:hypothetical protein
MWREGGDIMWRSCRVRRSSDRPNVRIRILSCSPGPSSDWLRSESVRLELLVHEFACQGHVARCRLQRRMTQGLLHDPQVGPLSHHVVAKVCRRVWTVAPVIPADLMSLSMMRRVPRGVRPGPFLEAKRAAPFSPSGRVGRQAESAPHTLELRVTVRSFRPFPRTRSVPTAGSPCASASARNDRALARLRCCSAWSQGRGRTGMASGSVRGGRSPGPGEGGGVAPVPQRNPLAGLGLALLVLGRLGGD